MPVVNVTLPPITMTANLPEMKAPAVTFSPVLPEQAAPVVNIVNQVETPVVNVTNEVQPAPVKVSTPTSATVTRDMDGRITGIQAKK